MNKQLLENPNLTEKSVDQEPLNTASFSLHMEQLPIEGYEQVFKVTHPGVGLTAIIAIHNTSIGPALGGVRIRPYASFDEALEDALRLSKAMTYKAAIAEVGFGGGKSVIIADPKTEKTPELLFAFGTAVEKLAGKYICAEDMGCTFEDMNLIHCATNYVVGLLNTRSSGDPGPFTAWGTFRGIQSASKKIFGTDSLEGRIIAIQGLGNVGGHLIEPLFWAGAELILSDADAAKTEYFARKYGAKAVPVNQILKVECDILAPCALGGIVNDSTIPELRCRAIAGSANNQLLRDTHANVLRDKGILYAPDFVINAGGLLNVAMELENSGYHPASPRRKSHRIYDTLLSIYEIAEKNQESTHAAALALADYRIKYSIGKRTSPPKFHHTPE